MKNIAEFKKRYNFTKENMIGEGGFSRVFKAYDTVKEIYVAIKVSEVRPKFQQFTLQREVELVNELPRHDNIAQYQACYRFYSEDSDLDIDYAVLKYYEHGNLSAFLKTNPYLDEKLKKTIIKGILEGIKFLHSRDIIHRDLKAQNILIHKEDGVWIPKITDLGLSGRGANDEEVTNSSIGFSRAYAAPEQINGESKIHRNVDIWAYGVLLYQILTGELPFKSDQTTNSNYIQNQLEVATKIITLQLPEKLNSLPDPYQVIIRGCLVIDPKERVQNATKLLQMLDTNLPPQDTGHGETELITDKGHRQIDDTIIASDPIASETYHQIPGANETHIVEKAEPIVLTPQSRTGDTNTLQKWPWKWIGIVFTVFLLIFIGYYINNQDGTAQRGDPFPVTNLVDSLQDKLNWGNKWLNEHQFSAAIGSFNEALAIDSTSNDAKIGLKKAVDGKALSTLLGAGNSAMANEDWKLAKLKYDSALILLPALTHLKDSIAKADKMLQPPPSPPIANKPRAPHTSRINPHLVFGKLSFDREPVQGKVLEITVTSSDGKVNSMFKRTISSRTISLGDFKPLLLSAGCKYIFEVKTNGKMNKKIRVMNAVFDYNLKKGTSFVSTTFEGVKFRLDYEVKDLKNLK